MYTYLMRVQCDSPWSSCASVLPEMESYTIHDYECEEFAALVRLNTHQQSLFDQMTALFALLDKHWDSEFARYRLTQVSVTSPPVIVYLHCSHLHQWWCVSTVHINEISDLFGSAVVQLCQL